MIRMALGLELRGLVRSPLRLLLLVVVLGVGWFVTLQGQADVLRWDTAIAEGEAAEAEAIQEARAWLSAGATGPADRPWINLSQAHYQDLFAATRISRPPSSLAGIAFASAESGAVTMRLNRFADPMVAQGSEIQNPSLAAAGGLDLVTVLSLLVPLLVLALGVELGGFERSSGLLPLVQVQSGKDSSWVWARCVAVGLIVAVVASLLCGFAAYSAGAGFEEASPLFGLTLLYVGVWTALLAAVATVSRDPSHGAVLLGAAWILLCVIIPSVGVEESAALAADDFALDLTVEARDARGAAYEMSETQLFAAVYDRFPELKEHEPSPRSSGVRHARDGIRLVGLEDRMLARHGLGQGHSDIVSKMVFASPTFAFSNALETLAGRGPGAARAFSERAVAAIAERTELVIKADWKPQALGSGEFEELVSSSPGSITMPWAGATKEYLVLGSWLFALSLLTRVASRRMKRA